MWPSKSLAPKHSAPAACSLFLPGLPLTMQASGTGCLGWATPGVDTVVLWRTPAPHRGCTHPPPRRPSPSGQPWGNHSGSFRMKGTAFSTGEEGMHHVCWVRLLLGKPQLGVGRLLCVFQTISSPGRQLHSGNPHVRGRLEY